MNRMVRENLDGSLVISTPMRAALVKYTEQEIMDILTNRREQLRAQQTDRGEPVSESLNYVGIIQEKDYPNAAQPATMDGLVEVTPATSEVTIEDYVIEGGVAVKAPVSDNIRHLRGSWRWDVVNNKIIEDAAIAKTLRSVNVRAVRDRLLTLSDQDEFRLTGQALADAKTYRQELRDLGAGIDADPENVAFPVRLL